jgi:chemotaxis protein MotA
LEKSTLMGLLAGAICIIISILLGGALKDYGDIPSVFIVIGGTIASTVVSYPGKLLKTLGLVYKTAFRKRELDLQKDIDLIIDIANIARREGLLALEDAIANIDNPFLKKGVMLVVDGADPELIKNVLEAEIYFVQERHAKGQQIIDSMADYAPAYGMIGTLIGLINMLKNLTDSEKIGPGMATALITTFYGVILANLLFKPISKKLKVLTAAETQEMELLLEGLLSIQDGENPRIIKDKLYAFISRREVKKNEEVREHLKPETGEIGDEP